MNLHNNLLAILFLVICSTCAQAQFDTVINLPDTDGTNPAEFSGDSIGNNGQISSSTQLNLSDGGSIGDGFEAGDSSGSSTNVEVNISGGTVGNTFGAFNGSAVNISGGTVGDNFEADVFSTVNISGGTVGDSFLADSDSTVNISGGTVGDEFRAEFFSRVNLFGTEFFLNGDPFDDLVLDEATTVIDRGEDVVLSGLLTDGTSFEFDLNSSIVSGEDFFDDSATLTVTLASAVPEPASGLTLATISILLLGRRKKPALRS